MMRAESEEKRKTTVETIRQAEFCCADMIRLIGFRTRGSVFQAGMKEFLEDKQKVVTVVSFFFLFWYTRILNDKNCTNIVLSF